MQRTGNVEVLQKYARGEYHANFPWKETTSKEYVFLEISQVAYAFITNLSSGETKKAL